MQMVEMCKTEANRCNTSIGKYRIGTLFYSPFVNASRTYILHSTTQSIFLRLGMMNANHSEPFQFEREW